MADAVEGSVFGYAAEGCGVSLCKVFELGFAFVGEGIAHGGLSVVGTGNLAAVAPESVAREVDGGRELWQVGRI